jgi:hypothetical protein
MDAAIEGNNEIFGQDAGDGFDGFMTYEELKTITGGKIVWPDLCD